MGCPKNPRKQNIVILTIKRSFFQASKLNIRPSNNHKCQKLQIHCLSIDEIKEEICEENEATQIQYYSEVYIKQGEFGALEYQNEKENERVDLEIKGEPINH